MDYDLAEQLKDAGYDQLVKDGALYFNSNEQAHAPTLSELIDACGKCGFRLFEELDGYSVEGRINMGKGIKLEKLCFGEGKTKEEAVAKLWLKLNKKNG